MWVIPQSLNIVYLLFLIMLTTKINAGYKKWLVAGFVLLLIGGATLWYIFTEKFSDTGNIKADYTVNALDLIREFQQDISRANKKYSEKIIIVNGTVSEIKKADTTMNIIMADPITEAYIIFAFQQQHLEEARQMKEGDQVSIKGSCSNGVYSQILGTEYITFKRCAVNR